MVVTEQDFEDDLLLELRLRIDSQSEGFVDGLEVACALIAQPRFAEISNVPSVGHQTLRRLGEAGFYKSAEGRFNLVSLITRAGLDRIEVIQEKRRPKSVMEKLLSESALKFMIVLTFIFTVVGVAIMATQLWVQLNPVGNK